MLGKFAWGHDKTSLTGRFSNLFLPMLPPSESPRELAERMRWVTWDEPEPRVVTAHLIGILDEVWESTKGDDAAGKTESIVDATSATLRILIAELCEKDIEKAKAMVEALPHEDKKDTRQDPIDRVHALPLAVPGYASERARQVIGRLLCILEGEMAAQDSDQLEDNILAGLVVAGGQIARVSDAQQRNRMIAAATDFIDATVKKSLETADELEARGIKSLEDIPGAERMEFSRSPTKLN